MTESKILESIMVAAAAVFLAVRMMRQRAFRVNRLWIQPAVVLAVVAIALLGAAPSPLFFEATAAGAIAGIVIGVLRAALAIDRVDLAARSILTKPSLWMAVLFAATFLLQVVVRHGPWNSVRDATYGVMCLTAASICAQRWQFYRVFQRVARGQQGEGPVPATVRA